MYWNILKNIEGLIVGFFFSIRKKMRELLSVFLFLSLIPGCANLPVPKVETVHVDQLPAYEMPDSSRIFPVSIDETIPDIDILAINNDITSLLDERVLKIKRQKNRLAALMEILVQKVSYDTANDSYGIKTAQETFDTGSGNCLSFSNLFIAMARYAGLEAGFQEIPTIPNWTREKEILFFTRHIGASVDINKPYKQIIQLEILSDGARYGATSNSLRYFFAPTELSPHESKVNPLFFQPVSDYRAFAQYYNNVGSNHLAEGDNTAAFRYFVKAVKTDPGLSFAWSNLGVVYRRNNQFDAAEAAYFQGFSATDGSRDPSVLTIINNLVSLYGITGDTEKEAYYKNQVASFRQKNPYYQYTSAKTAYNDNLYEKSIKHLNKAIRLKKDEHLFYYGLTLSYVKTGELKKAEKNINRAIRYAWDENRKTHYRQVRETLEKGSN